MNRRGDVHNLPPEDRPDADRKAGRPWLLLHDPTDTTPSWVFAYGSSQPTEAVLGATPLVLRWDRISRFGVKPEETNFFPARIQNVISDTVDSACGSARRHCTRIRVAFRDSLGIGERPVAGVTPDLMSRGRVVRLSETTRVLTEGARYAVVVTSADYAGRRRYQHLVPIYDALDILPEKGDVVTSAAWLRQLPCPIQHGMLAIPMLFTGSEDRRPFNPGQIAAFTSTVVDEATMDSIDAALIAHFGLD